MSLDGKSLERAASLIEKHILNHISEKEIGEVKIESNKIIISEGVRNEIDILVTIDLKIGTQLIYIFECKNYRTKKISKNDIIVFEEKIKISSAQKGYFVAKKYTKDSINRAEQNDRIELLYLDNENSRIFDKDYFIQIESAYIDNCNINIGVNPAIPFDQDFQYLSLKLPDSEIQTIQSLVAQKLQLGSERASKYRTIEDSNKNIEFDSNFEKLETIYRDKNKWSFKIYLRNPILDNVQYKSIRLTIDVDYVTEKPQIIFEYNIENKGHYAKIRMRGLFKNQYSTMEITKDDKTNKIHFHNIEVE